ncbi:hypothetical protein [Spiroplasma endosymbiont of Dasysyrphus albostriatus]|uniref:hypothetical protein n=1 Tax=Spiroplasma endosymbiont of Dasysyrphus albostriatus TaxID=3066299 RepID=UPI0030CBE742
MQNIINCGIYFANVPLTKTTNETRCENINCNYQYCNGCKLETVIIWTQTPDQKCLGGSQKSRKMNYYKNKFFSKLPF